MSKAGTTEAKFFAEHPELTSQLTSGPLSAIVDTEDRYAGEYPEQLEQGKLSLTDLDTNELMMRMLLGSIADFFALKNGQYGNAIEQTGVLGAITALTGDVAKLRKMILRSENNDHGRSRKEKIRDALVDTTVQAAIGILMLDKENWEGK